MKTLFISGASRGLGRALAEELAAPDIHLILLARTTGALSEIDDVVKSKGGSATLIPADLLAEAAANAPHPLDVLGARLFERFGSINIWCHTAAALGPLSPAGHLNPNDVRAVWRLNTDVPFRLIRSLDPLLRAGKAQTLFFSDFTRTQTPPPFWAAYASAKAGLEALALSYAAEMAPFGVTVALCDPGPMPTRLRANAFPGEDTSTLPSLKSCAKKITALLKNGITSGERYSLSA